MANDIIPRNIFEKLVHVTRHASDGRHVASASSALTLPWFKRFNAATNLRRSISQCPNLPCPPATGFDHTLDSTAEESRMGWGRCNRNIIAVAAFLDAATALASLTKRAGLPASAKQSHRFTRLLSRFLTPQWQVQFLAGGHRWEEAATSWLREVLRLSRQTILDYSQQSGFVYIAGLSTKHRCFYVGYCGSLRQKPQHRFGLFQRWFDHKVREIRPQHGTERRYKVWRNRAPGYKNHMLRVFVGAKKQAWALEQFIIRSFTLPVQGWKQDIPNADTDTWKALRSPSLADCAVPR